MATNIYIRRENDDGICVEWKIPNFFERQTISIHSPLFNYSSYELELLMFPKGYHWFEALDLQSLSMSLEKQKNLSKESKNIEYRMGIKKFDSTEFINEGYMSILHSSEGSTPQHKLISRSDLEIRKNEIVPEGNLTVLCYIRFEKKSCDVSAEPSVLSKYVTAISSERSSVACICKGIHTLSENFEDLYRTKRLTDVTITVLGKEFHAHKLILSARSEVFNAMFQHDSSELHSGVVHITDCDPHSFEDFLLYVYTGKMDTVSSTNAVSLFKTADKYGVVELKRECIRCMIQDCMTVGSFCNIFHLAVLHGESSLLASATDFFIKNANSILITKEWLSLLEEHTSLCNELIVKFSKSGVQK